MRDISVIIPTYNRRDRILSSVNSVLAQTYPVKEIIVADDCSQDDTEEVLKSLGDARVKYYRLPENRGAGGARNYGVERASCDIIAFHDSDDLWLPKKIERQMEVFEDQPETGLIYTAYQMRLQNDVVYQVPEENSTRNLSGNIFRDLLLHNSIGAPTILMRKEIFNKVGGFDEAFCSLEDWDLALRIAEKYPICFVPEVLVETERLEGGVSSDYSAYYQSRCYMIAKYRKQYLEEGLFDRAVENIFQEAQRNGILPQVQKMLMFYLASPLTK